MTDYHEQLKVVDDLYFVMQPVVKVTAKQRKVIEFYEVLLRSRKTKKFPGNIFFDLLKTASGNEMVLSFFESHLTEMLRKNTRTIFSINLEIIQFKFPETLQFFENMGKWSSRIIVEITERPYNIIEENTFFNNVKEIRRIGYRIFVDDIGCGRNTLSCVQDNIDLIDGIKYSWGNFKYIPRKVGISLLKEWAYLAQTNSIVFVFEGVDSIDSLIFLQNIGVIYQQGWYIGKPKEYTNEAYK
ncbi:EAL domain-containing protein [Leuconostoc sp. JNUCC 76]